VGCIRVIAAGSASSIQAGNNMRLLGDSRIKHIRQYPKKAAFHALGSVSQQLDPP
jgi:spore germination protein PE